MTGRVDVLAVMDTVARGCALHADKCVGETGDKWAKVCTDDYDAARAAVAELVAADREYDAAKEQRIHADNLITSGDRSDDAFRRQAFAHHAYDRAVDRRRAALARVQGGAA